MTDIEMNRKTWLEERKSGIGGSDCSSILGLNPYMSNVELWRIKTGRVEQEDISEKDCVKYGTKAEKHLRELFILDNPQFKVINEDYVTHPHPEYNFIKGSYDGIIYEPTTGRNGVLEIKTTTIRRSQDWDKWDGKIPQNYFCQILHYFIVGGFDFAVLKAHIRYLNIKTGETDAVLRHYTMNRKDYEADIVYLLGKEIEFWKYIEEDKEPPLILPSI